MEKNGKDYKIMKLQPKNKKNLLKAALGKIDSDLVVANVQLVNVFTGEIYPADVYVYEGFVAHVETNNTGAPYKAKKVYDGKGKYLIPGLVDAHMHIESSMLTPRNFAKVVIPNGTTTIIHDPHEIGNVYGVEGVKYMHDSAADLPMRQLVDIPSCVPAVPGRENAGAAFLAGEVRELAKLDRVVGLAEVMDFMGVMEGDDRMMDIIAAAEENGLYLQGHSPRVTGRELSAYLCGGPYTDHESLSGGEAVEKLRDGMYVDARESSISHNMKDVCSGVKSLRFLDSLCMCTDDRESDDLLHQGHLNAVIRKAIECGLDPVLAIKCGTINTAREIGIRHLGAVAPGYTADMALLESLEEMKPQAVFFGGELVAENGKLLAEIPDEPYEIETRNSVTVKQLTTEDFVIHTPIRNGTVKVNVMKYDSLTAGLTTCVQEDIEVRNGLLRLTDGLMFVAVVNRYPNKDTMALHVVRDFGTNHGALASTISHDSHNLTIVYDTPEDALAAAEELIRVHGGITAVENGKVLQTLPLEVGGLMTRLTARELSEPVKRMKEAERSLGLTQQENPLLRIVTLALPVSPKAKMSDLGFVDVATKTFIPLFAAEK